MLDSRLAVGPYGRRTGLRVLILAPLSAVAKVHVKPAPSPVGSLASLKLALGGAGFAIQGPDSDWGVDVSNLFERIRNGSIEIDRPSRNIDRNCGPIVRAGPDVPFAQSSGDPNRIHVMRFQGAPFQRIKYCFT